METAARARDRETFYPLNIAFHEALGEAAGNHLLIIETRRLATKVHLFRRRGLVAADTLEQSNAEHRLIVQAIASGDPQRAHNACFAHIVAGCSRLLARLASEEEAAEAAVMSSGDAGRS